MIKLKLSRETYALLPPYLDRPHRHQNRYSVRRVQRVRRKLIINDNNRQLCICLQLNRNQLVKSAKQTNWKNKNIEELHSVNQINTTTTVICNILLGEELLDEEWSPEVSIQCSKFWFMSLPTYPKLVINHLRQGSIEWLHMQNMCSC